VGGGRWCMVMDGVEVWRESSRCHALGAVSIDTVGRQSSVLVCSSSGRKKEGR